MNELDNIENINVDNLYNDVANLIEKAKNSSSFAC